VNGHGSPRILGWLRAYRRADLAGDVLAGVIVAMMMIPQGMAYALVAGLPPVAGLYASIVPPLLYALFGTSSTQSVGPMAIISLMTASALAPLASPGSWPRSWRCCPAPCCWRAGCCAWAFSRTSFRAR
jgi:SulP family sulfate permease